MKLEEIRKGYEETSGTFSNSVRNLSISGIAIAWLFMSKESTNECVTCLLIALVFFVLTLFIDLIQNFSLSVIWYLFYKNRRMEGKKEEDEVDEPESKNTLAWILYGVKIITLFTGYVLIVCHIIK